MTKEHTDPVIERGANGQAVEHLNIGGRVVEVDAEIAPLVRALNAAGVATVASCSGHGHRPGNIALRDGREIIIARDFDEARQIDALFPLDINGDNVLARAGVSRQGDEVRCGHEAYQGYCCHCGVQIVNGRALKAIGDGSVG